MDVHVYKCWWWYLWGNKLENIFCLCRAAGCWPKYAPPNGWWTTSRPYIIHYAPHPYPRVPNCTNRIARPWVKRCSSSTYVLDWQDLGRLMPLNPPWRSSLPPLTMWRALTPVCAPSQMLQHLHAELWPSCTPLLHATTKFHSSNLKALIQGQFDFCGLDWVTVQIIVSLDEARLQLSDL
jgi:hypothetical protein